MGRPTLSEPLSVVVATELVAAPDAERLGAELAGRAAVTYLPLPWRDGGDATGELPVEWERAIRGAQVVVGFAQQLPHLPAGAPRLRLVQHAGAGVDAVEVAAFARAGVGLVTAAGIGAASVGDFALAALLSLALRHSERQLAQAERRWQRFPTAELGELRLLVVGGGPVAHRLCATAGALGIDVTVARHTPARGAPPGARRVIGLGALNELLAQIDAIVLAVPLTAQTRGLIGPAELALLPRGAFVVNVARGEVLDESALLAALRGGRLGGAWLDVFAQEPLSHDSPLWDAPRLRLSAHDATAVRGYSARLARRARETVAAWCEGRPVPHAVVAPRRREERR